MAKERLAIGVFCGPAVDGVDAAMVHITGRGERMKVRPLHESHHPFDDALRGRLIAAMDDEHAQAAGLASLDREVTAAMIETANAVMKLESAAAGDVAVVGLGGPIVVHTPRDPKHKASLAYVTELGSVGFAASRLGMPTVGQFAQSDAGAGGCGGPVSAWADWLLFRDKRLSRVLIHLGGLVTLTQVGTNAHPLEVVAFDVGPGTMLMDALTRELMGRPADVDGAFADRGRASASMLNELLANPYFRAPAPKITHRRAWSGPYLTKLRAMAQRHRVREEDVVATASELVAHSVAQGVKLLTERPHEIILTGGGARNIHLASRIRTLLSPSSTINSEKFGIAIRAKQSIVMAVLAMARLDNTPIYCPYATGAKKPTPWGSLCG
ncbi:MAG: anhydro-N-acetylmuramic acid kinase [Phycisphaerae bacterium]|nr:anhydro-N-acetylmuramic acid kinase [Phycisphaerae bacterium]